VTEALQVAGCIAAAAGVGAAMLLPDRRLRAAAMLTALAIALALLLGEGWDELSSLRGRPAVLAALAVAAAAGLVGLALALRRWPQVLPPLLVATLPFRIPIDVGGDEVNLLLPLYVVIAAGALAYALDALLGDPGPEANRSRPPVLLYGLAAAVLLYAVQASYSSDVPFATRNVGFFLVPFGALFVLLYDRRWTPRLLGLCLAVAVGEALLFSLVGVGQHIAQEIFWNPALERSNEFHFYFRVNSLFWDPNIYGRYLALVAVLVVAVVMWTGDRRRLLGLGAILAVLLAGLAVGLSQTSFAAVLVGVAVLCALRYSLLWTAIAVPFAVVAVIACVFVIGGTSEAEDSATEVTSGRSSLVEGGWELTKQEPLIGHGSASFSVSFTELEDIPPGKTSVSHNEPVTVAAEQGAVGLLVYLGTLAAAIWTLMAGMRALAPGLGAPRDAITDPADGGPGALALGRVALVAAFAAMLLHTLGYGAFLTDPLTWTLLAIGGSLADR
jgi:putative inorganic carbon (hco3(-)) transporter